MFPTVSVIIPTYNYSHYIVQAVNSVLQQTYPIGQIEIIVVDDGSTDNTKEVLQPFIDRGLMQYFYQQNKGKASATHEGIQRSSGKYIFNLDADDYFLRGKIAASVDIFEKDNSVVHVAAPAQLFYQDTSKSGSETLPGDILGKPIDGNLLLKRFYNNNFLFGGGSTYAARASVLKSINIPEGVDMYIDEFLLLAVLPHGKSYFIPQPLSVWRVHGANYSGNTKGKDKQLIKADRLMKSSSSLLAYLQQNDFDPELVTIYRLQDATRKIALKEYLGIKKARDIFQYASEVFLRIKPAAQLIVKYNVINRLIPTGLFNMLKNIKTVFKARQSVV